MVLLSLPYEGMPPILENIRGALDNKIVINIASALDPERKSRAKLPPAGSITAQVQQSLGSSAKVVAAFQNISPEKLETVEEKIDDLIESKRQLSQELLEGGAELLLTEMNDDELLHLVALDIHKASKES